MKTNIAELLKDCPSGMELDCVMYDNLYFKCVREHPIYPIVCYTINSIGEKHELSFNWFGKHTPLETAKCVIFPKGKTTWEGFVPPSKFKDGDVVTWELRGSLIAFIYKERKNAEVVKHHFALYTGNLGVVIDGEISLVEREIVLATEEEKQKLFQAIRECGYKWNAETKTLKKLIEPEFKVGDKITNGKTSLRIGYIDDEYYYDISKNLASRLPIKNQDKWNLIPKKFDITTLKPFESKVLVRTENSDIWEGDIFVRYDRNATVNKFHCIGAWYEKCIPFNGNEWLLGTTDNCGEYYKTWE